MKRENVKKYKPSKEVRDARVRLAKENLMGALRNIIITAGVVAVLLAIGPTLSVAFPAFAGAIKIVGATSAVLGSLFVALNLYMSGEALAVIGTGGRYYPGYIRTAGDDTKEENLVEAHGVRESED